MIRISFGPAPAAPVHRTKSEAMRAWSDRVHGPGWQATRARYWHDPPPWRRTRCYWCRRADPRSGKTRWTSRRRLELHHLTYLFSGPTGACPFFVVRPMCKICHDVEGWLKDRYDPGNRHPWIHGKVTWIGRQVFNAVFWVPVLILGFHVGLL